MFKTVSGDEPSEVLPDDLKGKRIALKLTGGVGDVLMALGGTAHALLTTETRDVTVGARDHQLSLLRQMYGVDHAVPVTRFNDPSFRREFDCIIDFSGTFANQRQIRQGEYYHLVSEKVGRKIRPGRFRFPTMPNTNLVLLHAGASNPNRRWSNERWQHVAYALAKAGHNVKFLGTKEDFGIHDPAVGIERLCEMDEDLTWQAKMLAVASYFIGMDSGFAHIAGILQVPGLVLFSCTHPRDVIAQYWRLKGVHVFDRTGTEPSRSLRMDDEPARRCMEALQVDDVLKAAEIPSAINCTVPVMQTGTKHKIKVLGEEIVGLDVYFDIEYVQQSTDPVIRFGSEPNGRDLVLTHGLSVELMAKLIKSWLQAPMKE